jgi:hypothetical protein
LSEWLTDPKRLGGPFRASVRKGHVALAGWLWKRYAGKEGEWPAYLVRHLPRHLQAAGRWDDLVTVLARLAQAGDDEGVINCSARLASGRAVGAAFW